MAEHDLMCMWSEMAGHGVTPPPAEDCVYCPMIRAARTDEVRRMENRGLVSETSLREQAAKEILAFVKGEHSETCPCDQCIADEWLMFAARVVARDEDYQDWESQAAAALERNNRDG
jgi:hypothetical protein